MTFLLIEVDSVHFKLRILIEVVSIRYLKNVRAVSLVNQIRKAWRARTIRLYCLKIIGIFFHHVIVCLLERLHSLYQYLRNRGIRILSYACICPVCNWIWASLIRRLIRWFNFLHKVALRVLAVYSNRLTTPTTLFVLGWSLYLHVEWLSDGVCH